MNHTLPTPLNWPAGSIAYFAKVPARRLLIFVHGFRGKAFETWLGMDAILNADQKLADTDVVFYGYRSTASRAAMSAGMFRQFVDEAAERGETWAQTTATATGDLRSDRPYGEIVIVAHSLGAAISRRAILDAIKLDRSWPSRTKLLLFAPAHLGSTVEELLRITSGSINSILSNLFALAAVRMPVLLDLKRDSDFVQTLRIETQARLDSGWNAPLKATTVIFGQHEKVVEVANFCADPPPNVWEDHDHVSVCKGADAPRVILEQM